MPTIQLTNNTTLNIAATSADGNTTIDRYLKNPLSFLLPPNFKQIADEPVKNLDSSAFPISAGATAAGTFALEKSSWVVNLGASAAVNLLTGDSASDLCKSLDIPSDPALVSFCLQGTLSAGPTYTSGDFSFGVTKGATVSITSYAPAALTDTIGDALKRAAAGITIPHDLKDLESLPAGGICQLDAQSSLKFTASVTYNFVNNPLATIPLANLPQFQITATAGATLEGTATHTSDHKITLAKTTDGLLQLCVSLTNTDDFETSLTVSAGLTADLGSQDALAFLLSKTGLGHQEEMAALKADIPDKAKQISSDIKSAIDASLCSSLQASLKTALEHSDSRNNLFLYEIDLNKIDQESTPALLASLAGDFTHLTSGQPLAGITQKSNIFTDKIKDTHTLTVHLLGIFNYSSTHAFLKTSTVDYTKDTHDIVLSDEVIDVGENNLASDKLRHLMLKAITYTLPLTSKSAGGSNTIVFFDREASTDSTLLRHWLNVLQYIGSDKAGAAQQLIDSKAHKFAASSMYLSLTMDSNQARRMFVDADNLPYTQERYIQLAATAQRILLANDDFPTSAERLKLFAADLDVWKSLEIAGAAPNVKSILAGLGILDFALEASRVDAVTLLWWSGAMASYSQALVNNTSLLAAAKAMVKDADLGFAEPWMTLVAWALLNKPALDCTFTCNPRSQASRAAV